MAGKSTRRVLAAAEELGLEIEVVTMPDSTRTAADAAKACGCAQAQIVKSLLFERTDDEQLVLVLVAGDRRLDLESVAADIGTELQNTNGRKVREVTGFAIGGVAPIGHLSEPEIFADPALLEHPVVWAAAGAPNAVFSIDPAVLIEKTGAVLLSPDATE